MDGYVLIIDSGVTTRRQVQDTMVMLEPTPCIGTVLNRYRGGLTDSYGYGYGYSAYGRYYSE
jgi:protein-tyrosine kinase